MSPTSRAYLGGDAACVDHRETGRLASTRAARPRQAQAGAADDGNLLDNRKSGPRVDAGQMLSLERLRKFAAVAGKPRLGLARLPPYDLDRAGDWLGGPPAVIGPLRGRNCLNPDRPECR